MCGFGDVLDGFNFSTERKRILNHKYEPSFDDNVKQVRAEWCPPLGFLSSWLAFMDADCALIGSCFIEILKGGPFGRENPRLLGCSHVRRSIRRHLSQLSRMFVLG